MNPLKSFFVSNSAAVVAAGIDVVNGLWQEFSLADGEKSKRFRFVRFGEYPQTLPNGQRIVQVVDRDAVDSMVSNFRKFGGMDVFFKGVPIYEGHADDPDWLLANPGHKATAVGRIKKMEAGDDGMYVESVYNSAGVGLLSGEAPAYSGHSPRWRLVPIDGRPHHYRPVLLWSDALTNSPNIPGSVIALNQSPATSTSVGADPEKTTNQPMKLTEENLRGLGIAADATEEQINAAITRLLSEKVALEAKVTTASNTQTLNKAEIDRLTAELQTARGESVVTAINTAIASRKITEAERPTWEAILKADFASGMKALGGLPEQTAINTANHLGNLGDRKDEGANMAGGIDAMNSATREYARKNNIDTSTPEGWDRAWNGAKAAKPETFARKG